MHGHLALRLRLMHRLTPRRALHPGWAACKAPLLGRCTTPIFLQPPTPATAWCGCMHHSSWLWAPAGLRLSLSPAQQAVLVSEGHGVLVLQGQSSQISGRGLRELGVLLLQRKLT